MKFREWTCVLLVLLVASIPGLALGQPLSKPVSSEKNGSQQPALGKGLHVRAVELARESKFELALPMLEKLYAQYPNNLEMFFDYLVILTWDKQNEKAISLYENKGLSAAKLPDYVKMAMGGAYFSVGKYPRARSLFGAVANNLSARIAEAQSAMLSGAPEDGEKIFSSLLSSGQDPMIVYRERAVGRELIGAYKEASLDRLKLLEIIPDTPENNNLLKQTTADVLRDLIKGGTYSAAIEFAQKQLSFMAGEVYFESDYIVALQQNRDFKAAVSEADRLWGPTVQAPSYGLQSVAESYIELGKWKQAIRTYERIIAGGGSNDAIVSGQVLAYALNGQLDLAKPLFEKLASRKNQETNELMVINILSLIDYGKIHSAQQLFKIMVAVLPDADQVKPRVQIGQSLLGAGYNREAYEHFNHAYKVQPDNVDAMVGITRSAIAVGDYELAKKMLDRMQKLQLRSPEIIQVSSEFQNRETGNMAVGFYHVHNHLNELADDFVAVGEQRVSNAMSVFSQWRRLRMENTDTQASALLFTASAGVGRIWMNDSIRLWYDHHWTGSSNQSGFRVSYVRNFGEHTAWDLTVARHPYEDTGALRNNIMQTDYTLGFTRIIGPSRLRFAYVLGGLSDGNGINGFSGEWQRTWKDNDKTAITTSLFVTQARFREQEINGIPVVYDSPVRRETFGASIAKRWKYKNHYWELAPTLRWERDWPQRFLAGPSIRLEYGKSFSANHGLILGVEYGVFFPQEGGSLRYGSLQYDFSYYANW